MKEEFQEKIIRLMGKRQFDEKIRRSEKKLKSNVEGYSESDMESYLEGNMVGNPAESSAEKFLYPVFRRFGDIRMVIVPFEERTENYGEILKNVSKMPEYERRRQKNLIAGQKNRGAVIYNFNNVGTGYSVAAERNFSDRYGGQIYSYEKEKIKNYRTVTDTVYNTGTANMYAFSGNLCENDQVDFDCTMRNTSRILPARLFATEHIADSDMLTCGDYFSDRNIFSNIEKFNNLKVPENGYRLTNTAWRGGAVAAFYPGVLRRIGILLRQDFYIVFPSPDEARIHPVLSADVRQIGLAIRKSNRKLAAEAPCDIITDKVYRYCRSLKMLKEVEFYEW